MFVKKKYEAKDPKGFVTFINRCYNAYCEPTPDGILLEVTLIDDDGKDAATAAVNVARPFTEEKISTALQYAALKGIYQYIGNNLASPAKDGGASTKKVAASSELFKNLGYGRPFKGAATFILRRLDAE